MTSSTLRGALTALALALLATPALAQAPTPAPDGVQRHSPGRAQWREMMEQHRAAMAQDLRTILKLRPDQEAAFTAFQASMTPPPRDERKTHDRAAMETMSTPQKLDMMLARMDEHMARMRKHVEATKAFYAALSPDQQRTFDALERMHHQGMGGHGGHMHGGMGEGPPPPPGE
jgi:hypothetical protein